VSSLASLFHAGGGLVFYLGPDVINATARIVMSCFIVISNTGFLVTTTFLFIREMIKELRDNGDGKFVPPQRSIIGGSSHSVSELSLEGGGGGGGGRRNSINRSKVLPAGGLTHTRTTVKKIHNIEKEAEHHDLKFRRKSLLQQEQARENTMARVKARMRLKQSKALHKCAAFASLPTSSIEAIVDHMKLQKGVLGDTICVQGDPADTFYCVMSGALSAWMNETRVGRIHELQFFGESCFLEGEGEQIRNATVKVDTENVRLLVLSRSDGLDLLGKEAEVLQQVRTEGTRRRTENAILIEKNDEP
jgi:CRP-like cAMP-binding protein